MAIGPTLAGRFRVLWKVSAIVLASVVLMPLQWAWMRVGRGRAVFVLPRWWFGCLRRALGIRLQVAGTPRSEGSTLFVGNHVSHFDIVVLGSLLQARFIAKDDMERWPGMRAVGALAQTLFISRRSRDAASVAAGVAAQLRPGQDVVLFPEGTTSAGLDVAPFKSSLFALFLEGGAGTLAWTVQPFTLEIVAVDGVVLEAGGERDAYAFYGDMAAGAHVLHFLALRGAQVRVVFHPPQVLEAGAHRKQLALQLHRVVASALPPT